MANLEKLRGKETNEFISETIAGLKAIRRLSQEATKDLRELEREIEKGDSHAKN